MQLSNKILFGFIGFILLYVTAAFTELRLTGTPYVVDDKNSIAETREFPAFAYLVIDDAPIDVQIMPSDKPKLEIRSFKGDIMEKIVYEISGDSVRISAVKGAEFKKARMKIYVPRTGFRGIKVDNSTVTIEGLEQDTISIVQRSGNIRLSECSIGNLQINANAQAHFTLDTGSIKTLSLQLQSSHAAVFIPVQRLAGAMQESSSLRLNNAVAEIQFKKDDTSALNIY